MFTGGALVFVLSVLRLAVVHLNETPRYFLAAGKDLKIFETLQTLANKCNRHCYLTLEQLEGCGVGRCAHAKTRFSTNEPLVHLRGLFATKKLGLVTAFLWLSWTVIGLVNPLFFYFFRTCL